MSDAPRNGRGRRRRYATGRDEIDQALEQVFARLPPELQDRRADFAREIATSAIKLLLDDAAAGDVKLINSAVKELRYAAKVFKPWRGVRKVSVFGSARTRPGDPAYEQARAFGTAMATHGWMVITGAGGGIMEAAHGGAGREASFGVNIHLPFEQAANETVRGGEKLINFKYFFTRKLTFMKETDAVVLFPGGFGTHDEGFETLTLVQTGKADPLPIVYVEPPGSGYWREWHAYVERHLREPGLISPGDTGLYRVTDDVAEAVREVCGFYRNYHSSRYVDDLLVIRLQAELPDEAIAELQRDFGHLVRSGGMEQRDCLPEEAGQPEIAHLPRLVFPFTRDDFAGLRALIDRLNSLELADARRVPRVGPHPEEERAERGAIPDGDAARGRG
jgi:uncharacterized protein (TIGR00730 family)